MERIGFWLKDSEILKLKNKCEFVRFDCFGRKENLKIKLDIKNTLKM
jgi:hypothetical protein